MSAGKRFVWFLFFALPALGQPAFRQLTTTDGLSHNVVYDIVQDRKGFMWFATGDGLNRYDGQSFQVYRHRAADARSLSSNEVISLYEDSRGQLWAGTRSGGLNRLLPTGAQFSRITRTRTGTNVATAAVTGIAEDRRGQLWATTFGKGLLRVNLQTGQVDQLTAATGHLLINFANTLHADPDGTLWIGYVAGNLTRLDPKTGRPKHYKLPRLNPLAPGNIMAMLRDRQGRLWVGSHGWGLFRFDEAADAFVSVNYRPGLVDGVNIARSLYEDGRGRLWIATDDGLLLVERDKFAQAQHLRSNPAQKTALNTHALVCVRGDRQGNVWIGAWESGLNVAFARPDPFEQYTHQTGQRNSLLSDKVSAVAAEPSGDAWIGSGLGLSHLDRRTGTYRHVTHQPGNPASLAGNDITTLYRLSEQALLVGIWNKGIDVLNPKTGTVIRHLGASTPWQVYGIQAGHWRPSPKKPLWFILNGRPWRLHPDTWTVTPSPVSNRLPYSLTSLLEASDGTLWMGTYGDGLITWHQPTGRLHHYFCTSGSQGLSDCHITALAEDRQRMIWIGTSGGLHRYDPRTRTLRRFSARDGLPNDAIMSIQVDERGNLWIATNEGLCRYDTGRGRFRTYRQEDGLPGNDFSIGASSRSADSTLLFGGKHGLVAFRPARLEPVRQSFPVYLTGLKLFNRPVVPGEADAPLTQDLAGTSALTLRHAQSVVTFEFAAVLFQAHRNVRYAYRLDGFEDGWNYVGPQRSATYTNLDPGTYRFRVRASLTDDFTNASETSLALTVLPPWYRTGWAYAGYTALIAGLLLLIRRLIQIRERYQTEIRLEHLEAEKARELDRLRSGFFTNISHEFRTPLTLILSPLEQLLSEPAKDPPPAGTDRRRGQFQSMLLNANRLLRLINQLLDLSKLESGTLRPDISRHDVMGFVQRVAESFRSAAEKQRITLRIETDPDQFTGYFDVDILEKALYNLIANALRFTGDGGSITVRCRLLDPTGATQLYLEVGDTGIGIPPEHLSHIFDRFYQVNGQHRLKKAGTGIGLALTRELIELHRGSIAVQSEPGEGTVFFVTLPIHETAFPTDWLVSRPADLDYPPERPAAERPVPLPADAPPLPADVPLVLVVDDHDDLRQYLVDCFRPSYRVLSAANGQEALELAEKEVPDLVVSDWLMPDMDGVQLCEALKTDEKTSHVPFILLTSRSSTESRLHGLTVGADDYVTKPFNVALLRTRAQNLIQSRRLLREKYGRLVRLKPTDIVIESPEEQFLKKTLDLIEQHLADPTFDVQRLELELGMSTTQLYRKLKALTGKGGNDLIRSIRLQRAAQLLLAGPGRQVAEVAFDVGFNDPNYFARVFKKEYGCSPGEYGKKAVGV